MFESSTPPHGSATAGASPPNAGEINEDEELLIDFDDDHESQKVLPTLLILPAQY
jgi:hypothetical protein